MHCVAKFLTFTAFFVAWGLVVNASFPDKKLSPHYYTYRYQWVMYCRDTSPKAGPEMFGICVCFGKEFPDSTRKMIADNIPKKINGNNLDEIPSGGNDDVLVKIVSPLTNITKEEYLKAKK